MKLQYFLAALLLSLTTGQNAYCQHDNAKAVNASPLTIEPASGKGGASLTRQQEIQKQQMIMLWEVAVNKSPEFQMVLKKLIPSGEPAKKLKLIDALLTGGAHYTVSSTGNTIGPSFGAYGGDYSIPVLHNNHFFSFAKLLDDPNLIENKKAKLSTTELHDFYNSFRETFDRVIGHYRDYKLAQHKLKSANEDFEELKTMIADSNDTDTTKQIELNYALKKAQREIEQTGTELTRFNRANKRRRGAQPG